MAPALETTPRDKRLRISRLTLRDFRAFAGPDETTISFSDGHRDGRNLLLFGENGAGKSSLFEAMRGLFARRPDQAFFRREKNVFSGLPENEAWVQSAFTDGGQPATWTVASHPGSAGGDPRVRQVALNAAILDYRALLDTNYGQGKAEPNLFDVAMDHLLSDWPMASGETLGELWARTQREIPAVYGYPSNVEANCTAFNTEFALAVDALVPFAKSLLKELLGDTISLDKMTYGTVQFREKEWLRRDRVFTGKELRPTINFRTFGLKRPQFFLNEARQSALALAIFLSARLACTQNAQAESPKLLVLDDVLIGLDQSNRLPVLDVLMKYFGDWQIVLLTHDKVWFDMARHHLAPATDWAYAELYDVPTSASTSMPVVRHVGQSAASTALDQAEAFCAQGYIAAGATYARTAFEIGLRQWAERGSVPVRYRVDPADVSTQELIEAIRKVKATDPNGDAARALRAVEMFRTVVLSPLSHATPPPIVKSEVQGAIAAVRNMLTVSKK